MELQPLSALIAIASSLGVFTWQLKLYGTQREHSGKLEVLERAWTTSRSDHDTVVRLETEFAYMGQQLEHIRGVLDRMDEKLNAR